MPRWFPGLLLALLWAAPAPAAGLLIPGDSATPPLALLNHKVTVTVEDQVAVTHVEQTFRNHTDRALEATYVFPVPKGASVNKFTMWVGDKEVAGEMVEADKARTVYTDIVRRTQDPGLLEYMGNNLLRLRVFPVPARGDQKVSLRYTAVAARDSGLVEYVYPLKADAKAATTLEQFTLDATLKSQHAVQNVYSPTHPIKVTRPGDREVRVHFERGQAPLDKDFQLFYTLGDKDVGLTALAHRPDRGADGYFLLLVAPRAELSKTQHVARDMVFVLDTSGSMAGVKMEQARKALRYCLNNLGTEDRFALINFATTVNKYADGLTAVSKENLGQARKWVDRLEATGGTAIDDALAAALDLRPADAGRPFTVVFFTDGQSTVGETDPEKILKNVARRNTSSTRIFTFGVGDDVNAAMLDRLADQTRAVSTYVRPEEDIEVKVSGLYGKISHPVLTDLKLTAGAGVRLTEMYPGQLPDLFHGGQVVVLGRYAGKGHAALTLSGTVGKERREFVYEVHFPEQTGEDKAFVEDLWARRKVGYLLDQIRTNGEKKELVDEVVKLGKKHGITTPYTSYLVVPDNASPVANAAPASGAVIGSGVAAPPRPRVVWQGLNDSESEGPPSAPAPTAAPAPAPSARPVFMPFFSQSTTAVPGPAPVAQAAPAADQPLRPESREALETYSRARAALGAGRQGDLQAGKLAVDLALQVSALRNQDQLSRSATRRAAGRTCVEVGGAWVDEGFDARTPTVTIKAQGKAYFRILERHPVVQEVFRLGNRLAWVTPSGTALVVDSQGGQDDLTDAEIDKLFAPKK
jgi:Ca-activated chloride channel family protein